ncbi:Rsp5p-dependent ubiquitination, sorting of cargo proteins at the multivesicular body [Boothiomyces macroporosus]|uniref:Rsp5p-dependent ubiquitination, sorting of cargo proteins at the multivesicular body n=1 Tax=Boothiomyces macroporosus TaxID=261099 RepID=A0AAD5UC29_9FUNG|nr:Rsp5p-dependent ubiquitination, sorting of cargo proteins at the multivesicular body [Boothiomyces macroporosus]
MMAHRDLHDWTKFFKISMSANDTFAGFQKRSDGDVPGYLFVILPQACVWLVFFILFRLYFCLERNDHDLEDLQNSTEQTAKYRADAFLAAYPPDSQAANEQLKNQQIPNISMVQRNFYGFESDNSPDIYISEMIESVGIQVLEIKTKRECSLQCNAGLKQREFDDYVSPPPSFNRVECKGGFYQLGVIQMDPGAVIAIGFATCPHPNFRLPGYDNYSIGYHSSGKVFINDRGKDCIPFKVGDTVGIGYREVDLPRISNHTLNQTVFYFTHNGSRFGDEYLTDGFYPEHIFPTVGTTRNCKIMLEFGDPQVVFNPIPVYDNEPSPCIVEIPPMEK